MAGGATLSGMLLVPLPTGPVQVDLCPKGRSAQGAPTVRCLPRLPAEPETLAATHRLVERPLAAVAAGPILIKYFGLLCRFRWTFDRPCAKSRRDGRSTLPTTGAARRR